MMTLNTLRKRLTISRKNREDGSSDVVVTLFMIPFVIGLVFALIDVSTYFQVRSSVQNITRDGARQVALYGGASETIALNRETTGGKNITAVVMNQLWQDGNCTLSGCTVPPTATCGPNIAYSLNEDAYCTVTYNYNSIGGGIVAWLGFGAITGAEIKITETFKVETRY